MNLEIEYYRRLCEYNIGIYYDYSRSCFQVVLYLISYSFLYLQYFLLFSLFILLILYIPFMIRGDYYAEISFY